MDRTVPETEHFFERPYHIIDIFPKQVPAEASGRYAAAERYFLHSPATARRKTELLLKLGCYYDMRLAAGTGEGDCPDPGRLEELVRGSCFSVLVGGALIMSDFNDTYMTLYDPDGELLALVKELAASEGLFVWQPEDRKP